MVHRDDFCSSGEPAELEWFDSDFRNIFLVRTDYLVPLDTHSKHIRILNRLITWLEGARAAIRSRPDTCREDGARYWSWQSGNFESTRGKVVQARLMQCSVLSRKRASMRILLPNRRGTLGKDRNPSVGDELPPQQASFFRAVVARCNSLSIDRPGASHAIKELARSMSAPTVADWIQLQVVCQSSRGKPRTCSNYDCQDYPVHVAVYTDSDLAGCAWSCRSTTGCAAFYGTQFIKNWVRTEATVALSSAEAELCASIGGSSEALGLNAMLSGYGEGVGASYLVMPQQH